MTKHNFESTRSRPSDGVGQKTGYLGVPKSHVDSFARKKPHYIEGLPLYIEQYIKTSSQLLILKQPYSYIYIYNINGFF